MNPPVVFFSLAYLATCISYFIVDDKLPGLFITFLVLTWILLLRTLKTYENTKGWVLHVFIFIAVLILGAYQWISLNGTAYTTGEQVKGILLFFSGFLGFSASIVSLIVLGIKGTGRTARTHHETYRRYYAPRNV
jgi:hypothetical protein